MTHVVNYYLNQEGEPLDPMAPIQIYTNTQAATGATFYVGTGGAIGTPILPVGWGGPANEVLRPAKRKEHEPQVYFRYLKSKFAVLERRLLNRRLKELQAAFDVAVQNGQEVLADKFLTEFTIKFREAQIYAAGIREYIEREDVVRHRHEIRGGHISDTVFSAYTRIIPKNVLKAKKKVEKVFDGFVIYHYWDEKAIDVKTMSEEEKARMKDPVLFGIIRESNRMYFIADWVDEFCDLTFEEMTKVVGKMNV